MEAGRASVTAQRVAALRLSFPRVATDYGDPAADEELSRDVAGGASRPGTSPMAHYLAARTAFFDRVVVAAIDRGVQQIVVAAAGYDGRSLRYAKPGVRWWEVDHPATQSDKLARLRSLGIATPDVRFVAADFAVDDVAHALAEGGQDPAATTLFLCEGVAVYLELAVLRSLLAALASRACVGSLLAISLSVSGGGVGGTLRRWRFQNRVALVGEPARTVLTPDDASSLFAETGWEPRPDTSDGASRRRAAGLVTVTRASHSPNPVAG